MNAYIEPFHGKIGRECFNRYSFTLYDEVYYYIEGYIDFYNSIRPHGDLKNRSPKAFNQFYLAGKIPIQEISL